MSDITVETKKTWKFTKNGVTLEFTLDTNTPDHLRDFSDLLVSAHKSLDETLELMNKVYGTDKPEV